MGFNTNATNSSVVYVTGTRETKVLTADTAVTSDATLTTEAGLTIKLGPYERIAFRYNIHYSTHADADFKYLVNVPAAITSYRLAATGVGPDAAEISAAPITAEGSAVAITASSGTEGYLGLEGTLENGASAATLEFQWAQNSSDSNATTVRHGSSVEYIKY
tara:strand:+ start:96 stop:581 length:486 start_codon:yes stop_codon:yes gene_type:complete